MKHSAKAAARLAREREKLDRRVAARAAKSARAGRAGRASGIGQGSEGESTRAGQLAAAGPVAGPAVAGPAVIGPAPLVPPSVAASGLSGPAVAGRELSLAAAVADPAARRRLAQLPYALVLAGTVAGLVLMQVTKGAVRSGTLVIAGALLAGSLTRLVLPDGLAGPLRSRRRLVDVALLTALGVGLLISGLIVKLPG
jgi:hypothetical protein